MDGPPMLDDGAGLVLRPPGMADIPWMVRGCSDPEVVRWTTIPSPYSEDLAREFLEARAVDAAQGTIATFACVLDGAGAGMIDLRPQGHGVAEIGYWVGRWARRRRVASRAVRLVGDWAFATRGLEELVLRIMPGNTGSEGVAQVNGYRRGPLEPGGCAARGEQKDVFIWSLLAPAP